MSILRQFYRGLLIPAERRPNAEQTALQNKIVAEETAFVNMLSEEAAAQYTALRELRVGADSLYDSDLFAYAFSLGLMVGLEIVGELRDDATD